MTAAQELATIGQQKIVAWDSSLARDWQLSPWAQEMQLRMGTAPDRGPGNGQTD
jgi:hypothetical protein